MLVSVQVGEYESVSNTRFLLMHLSVELTYYEPVRGPAVSVSARYSLLVGPPALQLERRVTADGFPGLGAAELSALSAALLAAARPAEAEAAGRALLHLGGADGDALMAIGTALLHQARAAGLGCTVSGLGRS